MAKRTEEKPYRPLDATLVQAVMSGNAAVLAEEKAAGAANTVDLVRPLQVAPRIREASPDVVATTHRDDVQTTPRPTSRRPGPGQAGAPSLVERMEREKRVLLTASEERALERVVANVGAELGASLKLSHVLRSCIRILINSEPELVDRARATGRTVRPPNGDLAAIEAFEKVVANVLQAAIRSARPVR